MTRSGHWTTDHRRGYRHVTREDQPSPTGLGLIAMESPRSEIDTTWERGERENPELLSGHRVDLEVSERSVTENIFVLKWPFLHTLVAQSHTHFTYERLIRVDQLLSN